MLVYKGDFTFTKDYDFIIKIYLDILLSDRINKVKNIQHDEHVIKDLQPSFPQIGLNIFLSVTYIRNYYNIEDDTKNSPNNLFNYICHLSKSDKFYTNGKPYFIIDYELNLIRNEYMFKFENNFGYLRSISRSLTNIAWEGKAWKGGAWGGGAWGAELGRAEPKRTALSSCIA